MKDRTLLALYGLCSSSVTVRGGQGWTVAGGDRVALLSAHHKTAANSKGKGRKRQRRKDRNEEGRSKIRKRSYTVFTDWYVNSPTE